MIGPPEMNDPHGLAAPGRVRPLIIAIDPGKEALGWAVGVTHIFAAGLMECLDPQKFWEVWTDQAAQLRDFCHPARLGRALPIQVWVEFMQHRGGQRADTAAAKAKELLDLQFLGGALAGALAASLHATVHPVRYGTWAGGHAERTVQTSVLERLTSDEVCAMDAKRYRSGIRHNLRDAAGIFLYATGRRVPGMENV